LSNRLVVIKKMAKKNMAAHQKINEDGVRVWIKTGNPVGREKIGEGTQPYVPTGRPRGRPKKNPGKVVKPEPTGPKKGRGRPPKAADASPAKSRGRPAKKETTEEKDESEPEESE